jgi:WXXGXW repeat (2 copies)
MRTKSLLTHVVMASLLASSLGACAFRGRAFVSTPAVIVVDEEPPPPRRVVIIQKPGHIWIEGHWTRNGGRWDWNDGYYKRERADSDWRPGRWERRGHGHVWIEGNWQVRGGGHDHREPRGRDRHQDHR